MAEAPANAATTSAASTSAAAMESETLPVRIHELRPPTRTYELRPPTRTYELRLYPNASELFISDFHCYPPAPVNVLVQDIKLNKETSIDKPQSLPIITFKNIVKCKNNDMPVDDDSLNTSNPVYIPPSQPDPITYWGIEKFDGKYEDCLKSFSDSLNSWISDSVTPIQLAEAGFCYFGYDNLVKCIYCSELLYYRNLCKDSLIEHKRRNPQCQFSNAARGLDTRFIVICPDDLLMKNDIKQINHFLDNILLSTNKPKTNGYCSNEARRKTFEKVKIHLNVTIVSLCDAGFLYIGNGTNDEVLCFCCAKAIHTWEKFDDPWFKHAQYSPHCSFVLLSKGKKFVEDAINWKNKCQILKQENRFKLMPDKKYASKLDNNIQVTSLKRKVDDVDHKRTVNYDIPLPRILNAHSIAVNNINRPNKLCKVCYKEKISVAFIPCAHAVACVQCTLTLDQCPICKTSYNSAMRVVIWLNRQIDHVPRVSSQFFDVPITSFLCKICYKDKMGVVFSPCGHFCACVKCAEETEDCPICAIFVYGFTQIYF